MHPIELKPIIYMELRVGIPATNDSIEDLRRATLLIRDLTATASQCIEGTTITFDRIQHVTP